MSKQTQVVGDFAYAMGVANERQRIIEYLIKMDILREAIFYPGYVAFNTAGTQAMDLPVDLGAKENSDD